MLDLVPYLRLSVYELINMSHQLVVKTRLGETQIGLVVLDILNSTVGWCSHIGIFWELKHVETTDIKSHNSSHMGFSIMIQGLTQAKPSSFSAIFSA